MQNEAKYFFEATNLSEMEYAAKCLLEHYPSGGHFAVYGEMGAGKTAFIHCICRLLGLQFAGSPTFSIVNEYTLANGSKLFHFDLYRLEHSNELISIGFDEYLDNGSYVFVEWPQIAAAKIKDMKRLSIDDNRGTRTIEFS